MKNDFSIQRLCAVLEVAASGYYDWKQRPDAPGPRAQQNARLREKIKTIHAQSR